MEDKLVWVPEKSGCFAVKSYYKVLTSGSEESFPWKNIWKAGTPTRVAYFTWTAAKVKILSSLHWIIRRNFCIVNWHCLGKNSEELVDHLLIHCHYASSL